MKKKNVNFDLEDRLVDFAVAILNITEKLPRTLAGNYIAGQLTKSGTAPALLYGEAQSAESRKDFIHKMKVALKELRESSVSLKIIIRKPLIRQLQSVKQLQVECNELISIFVTSIKTAQNNLK